MKIMEEIKEHPYIAGVGVFVLGLILIFVLFSGNKATTEAVASPATDTSAATQVQMAAINANAAMYAADKSAMVSSAQTAAAISVAQLQAQTQQNSDNQNYQAATAVAGIQRDTAIGVSTLQATALMHESDNALIGTINTNAAGVTINGQNTNAAMTINGQNVSGAIAINGQNTDLAALHATLDNQAAIVANTNAYNIAAKQIDANVSMNATNQDYAYWTNASNNDANIINNAINRGKVGFAAQYDAAHN